MDTVSILKLETVNRTCIYLHREGSEWYAYEFSAFYLCSAFCVGGNIERVTDNNMDVCLIRLSLGKNPEEFFKEQEIRLCSEDIVEVKCKLKYGGFNFWKSRFIN